MLGAIVFPFRFAILSITAVAVVFWYIVRSEFRRLIDRM